MTDELEQLRSENEQLRSALKPFAKAAEMVPKIGLAHACAAYITASALNKAKDLVA